MAICTSLHSRRSKEEQNQVPNVSKCVFSKCVFSFLTKNKQSEFGVLYAKLFLF